MEKKISIKIERDIQYEQFQDSNLYYYIDKRIEETPEGPVESVFTCGITSKYNIERVHGLSSISDTVKASKMYQGKAVVVKISEENYEKVMNAKLHITEAIEDYVDDKTEGFKYVLWNWASHTIADLNGNLIPLPIMFDYIEGLVSNEYYDLEKLLEGLKKSNYVINRDELEIIDIPRYNATNESNRTIRFFCLIPEKEYEEFKKKDGHTGRRWIIDEVLGLKDCRK